MKQPLLRFGTCLLSLSLCTLGLGCGGGTSIPDPSSAPGPVADAPVATDGFLNVYLVKDGLAPQYTELNVLLSSLELQVDGVWKPVPLTAPGAGPDGAPPPPGAQSVDLLTLTPDNPRPLASQVPWPAGKNTKLRLTLGAGGSVVLAADESRQDLLAPEAILANLGLPGSFSIAPKTAKDLWITLDVSQVNPPETEGAPYVFKPVAVRGYDKAATGSITGTLKPWVAADSTANEPPALAGVRVTAQLQRPDTADGAMLAMRSVATDAEGKYTLDLLPLGYTWCVVSQPQAGPLVYGAAAGDGIALGLAPFNQASCDLVFSPQEGAGTLKGTVAGPFAAGETDTVDLVQAFPMGGIPYRFTVRTVPVARTTTTATVAGTSGAADVTTTTTTGAFTFQSVPPGSYFAILNRVQDAPGHEASNQRTFTAAFVLSPGKTMSIHF